MIRTVVPLVTAFAFLFLINGIYQIVRKPSELLFPLSGALAKTPWETWRDYQALFREYATRNVSPELLAALAQAEGGGNPVARTYWRWAWAARPFHIYRPASTSVGMYQMTDGTFAQAKNLCIRGHAVARVGARNDPAACPFNGLYVRILPSHAIELTSAYLESEAASTLARTGRSAATAAQRYHLAATIHLCGAGAGEQYARHGFRFVASQRCGEHDPRAYLARVDALQNEFRQVAARPQ